MEPANNTDKLNTETIPPLPTRVKFAFGVGQVAEGIQAAAFLMFLLFFYNQVLGVPGTLCGIAMAISLLFDAITDPMLGALSDAWRSKWGRRHPFMYVAALPLGVFFFLLFNPLVSGTWPLFFWLLVLTVCCRGAMTFYYVPHLTLGAELSDDFHERTALSALKQFFGACSYIGVFALGFGYYFAPGAEYPNGQLNPQAYGPLTAWLALTMVLVIWYSAFGTHSRIPYLPKASPSQRFALSSVLGETWRTMENKSFRSLILGFAMIIIAFGTAGALSMYMLTFYWELKAGGIFVVLVAGPIGAMFGYSMAKPFFNAFDKKKGVLLGVTIWLVAHILSVPLFILGWLPDAGSTGLLMAVAALEAICGFGAGQMLVGLGTMLADIADEHELHTDERREGVFFGAFSFINKTSAALGALIGGSILDLLQWPAGAGVRTAADVPADTLLHLGLMWGPASVLLIVPGLFVVARYRLNRQRHAEILRHLAVRRSQMSVAD